MFQALPCPGHSIARDSFLALEGAVWQGVWSLGNVEVEESLLPKQPEAHCKMQSSLEECFILSSIRELEALSSNNNHPTSCGCQSRARSLGGAKAQSTPISSLKTLHEWPLTAPSF